MRKFLIVIPARYSSSRFPGKPLADINGKSMLKRVWDKCTEATSKNNVIIATDDERIERHCKQNQMYVQMTSKDCLTGTDRLYQVCKNHDAQVYINVQGDEPLIDPKDINKIINKSVKNPTTVFMAMCSIKNKSEITNFNIPKVVINMNNELMYISRAAIPSTKHGPFESVMKQVCIYALPKKELNTFGEISKKTPLEDIEDIEILRLLETGVKVKMVEVSTSSIAVDVPSDIDKIKTILNDS